MDLTIEQKKAIAIIENHLNVIDNPTWTNEYIMENYDFVVDQIIENANALKNIKPSAGILQARESNQSVTFKEDVEAWTITSDIASMLPMPFVKMFY
ncbi:hypothetical protein [uncultured Clostridium sp.]|uniref:hypothetical protein n=1 Tax=uncultured Clostridium sp. TaxID=59620 RepID=UPI0028E70029|nr:hypothetical protein [uncultured Clostridium sp.]